MNYNLILAKKHFKITVLVLLALKAVLIIATVIYALNIKEVEAAYGLDRSIKQVKTPNSAAVYYLDHNSGMKKVYASAEAFLSYGNKWSDIKTISDNELNKWPEINLVKIDGDQRVYYIKDGKKYLIRSEQEFLNYGFDWNKIITISLVDINSYALGGFISASGLEPKYSGGIEEQLNASLNAASPKGDYLAVNTKDNLIAVFDLKSQGKITEIKTLTLGYGGVFNHAAISRVYLKDENDILIDPQSTSARQNNYVFNFGSRPFTVYPDKTRQIKVYVDLADNENCLNQTMQLLINSIEDINSNTRAVGKFPLQGAMFKLINADNMLGAIKAESGKVSAAEAIIGSSDHPAGKITISETSNNENLIIQEIILRNNGSANKYDLANLKIKDKTGHIIAQIDRMNDSNYAILKVNDYKIAKKSSEAFTVYCDVMDGDSKTINFQIINIKGKGANYGFSLNSEISNTDNQIKIARQKLGAASKGLAKSNNVFAMQVGVIFGVFQIKNNNQTVYLESLDFRMEKGSKTAGANGAFYLVDYETGEIYSSFDGKKLTNGKIGADFNNLIMKPKSNLNIALISDISADAQNGGSYKIILDSINYRAENRLYYSDYVDVAGDNLTINKSTLAVFGNDENKSYIKGQKGVEIGSFIIEAGAGEDAVIRNINIGRSDNSNTITYDSGFSNLRVYINNTKSKNTIAKPYGSSASFDFNYKIKAGSRVEIKVYADLEKNLNTSATKLTIAGIAAVNAKTELPVAVSGLGASSYAASYGETKAEIAPLEKGEISAGEKNNFVAGVKVKNSGNEDIKLSSLEITTDGNGFSYSLGYSNLKLVERWSGKTVGLISKPVANSNKINLNSYMILAGQEKIFDLYVDANDKVPSENIEVYFHNLQASGKTSKLSFLVNGDVVENITVAQNSDNGGGDDSGQTVKKLNLKKPVSGNITYYFHDPKYPYKDQFEHSGIDIDVKQGTDVKASEAGTVSEVIDGGMEYCSYVVIKHSDTIKTLYAHLSVINVKQGDIVNQGQVIGKSGGKPGTPGAGQFTNGPHLHFEVLLNDNPVDPLDYIK